MPLLSELRSSIIRQAKGQIPTDDEALRNRFVDHLIRQKRLVLAGSQAARGTGIDQAYYQQINCLEIKCSEVECKGPTRSFKSGKSYDYIDLPEIASFRDAIAYLGSVDGSCGFQQVNQSAFHTNQRFGLELPQYTLIGKRAFIKHKPAGRYFSLNAVLWDPAHGLCGQDKINFSYPVDTHDVHELELLCLKQILSTLQIPGDRVNDATNQQPLPAKPLTTT
jgi:hypothetical protein